MGLSFIFLFGHTFYATKKDFHSWAQELPVFLIFRVQVLSIWRNCMQCSFSDVVLLPKCNPNHDSIIKFLYAC